MGTLLVTGSRHLEDRELVRSGLMYALLKMDGVEHTLIVGGALGADQLAAELWQEMKAGPITVVYADWGKDGRAAGPIRNQKMVDMKPDLCLAFPLSSSRGTIDCINRARRKGVPVIEVRRRRSDS